MTLREYIAGPENRLVQVAADAIQAPRSRYNPLALFGPTATGKSHLACSLAELWKEAHPHAKIAVATGADFARAYSRAVETDALPDLRTKFRKAGLLVLDDLHELAGKNQAQQELIQTLDKLLLRNAWVLVTLKRAPVEMNGLLPALASRLSAGLTVPLAAPGPLARREILRRLAELHGVELPAAAVEMLADGLPGSATQSTTTPQLKNAVLQLANSALPVRCTQSGQLAQKSIDVELVRRFLAEQTANRLPSIRSITTLVAKYFHLKSSDLTGPARRQWAVYARGVAMYLTRRLTDKSLEQIGRYYGGRDHTTVLHACRRTEALLKSDPATRQVVDELTAQLTGS